MTAITARMTPADGTVDLFADETRTPGRLQETADGVVFVADDGRTILPADAGFVEVRAADHYSKAARDSYRPDLCMYASHEAPGTSVQTPDLPYAERYTEEFRRIERAARDAGYRISM